ncbi:MAG: adenylate kinase [Firmicutes bacterium]|nr:adenylate kinase [Bacillota bacterium]
MRLVFLGPPGAGKGTQADLLSEKTGLPHISPGDMFRRAVKEGSELGRKVKEYMDGGLLVPDDVTVGVIRERMLEPDCAAGFILDGFPRNMRQAEALDVMMSEAGVRLDAAVNFEVPFDILVERSVGRRVCRGCGATYHLRHNPPRAEGICDECGGELVQRDDDREETVKERLSVYSRETRPLVEYYREKGILVSVNGDQALDAVAAELASVLRDLAERPR